MRSSNLTDSTILFNGRPIVWQLIALTLTLCLLYVPIFKKLILDWYTDENYSHGFLIPLISGYFVWKGRSHLSNMWICPHNWGLFVLVFGLLLFVLGNIGAELFTMRISFIFVISGLILFILGRHAFVSLLFPICFLVFMVPIPYIVYNAITFPLRILASKMATCFLNILSVPVLREGNIIHLPGNALEVVDACSGIRSLVSLLALSTVYAYISQKGVWKRIFIIIATVPIAIFANALRIAGTGILSYHVSHEVAHGFFHGLSGWLVFLFAFILLFFLGMLINKVSR